MTIDLSTGKSAIARRRPSAPATWLYNHDLIDVPALDYGCGRGADAEAFQMAAYDPYWETKEPNRKYKTILCTFVLNVVTLATQRYILSRLRRFLATGGTAYITVRRDLPRCGMWRGRGCPQRFVTLPLPIVRETKSYCIYELSRRKKRA